MIKSVILVFDGNCYINMGDIFEIILSKFHYKLQILRTSLQYCRPNRKFHYTTIKYSKYGYEMK